MKKINIKKLMNKANRGERLSLDQWNWLTRNLKDVPEQFIMDFFPFFNWNRVNMEEVGYQKIFNILYGRSWEASTRHQAERYWGQYPNLLFDWASGYIPYFDHEKDDWVYGSDFSDLEYDSALSLAEQDFLAAYTKLPSHIQRQVAEHLWRRALDGGPFIEDLSWCNPQWEFNFCVEPIFSKDLGESTDRMLAGVLLFLNGNEDVMRSINLKFSFGRLVSIYKKYIEPCSDDHFRPACGYPPIYDFLDRCHKGGITFTPVPGEKTRQTYWKKKREEED